ncbi:hypothetical protein JW911_05190 [Candidatus Peregrinibacteria bacterium]|nr:hypothetical protein [Candidatus Peregrinibacteria bacterium]
MKYKKFNPSGKLILEKEGEIVINKDNFQLKGKGAGDIGETIVFGDMKEWQTKDEYVSFASLNKEKYVLSHLGNLYNDFLLDFSRARNEFLLKSLFMSDGEFVEEYEGDFEIFSKYDKSISHGHAKFRIFENSLVIVPDTRDAFAISFNFLKRVDIDEEFYEVHMFLDQGFIIHFKRLGTGFSEFHEKLGEVQQKTYQKIVDDLKEILLEFDSATLIKLAYEMKKGKAVSLKKIKKINDKLPDAMKEIVLHDELSKNHFETFSKMTNEENIYLGISTDPPKHQPAGINLSYSTWYFIGIPEKNLVVGEITNGGYRGAYFFKIIMEKGDPAEKVEEKLLEINQALLKLKFVTTAFYKDKRELRRSIYRFALRKLPYLRLLRRSYVGRLTPFNEVDWDKRFADILKKAELAPTISASIDKI